TGSTSPTAPDTVLGSGTTCADILADDPSSVDGVYTLTSAGPDVEAWCDMAGGGWTLAFVSNRTATDKAGLAAFYEGEGTGSLYDNASHYAIDGYRGLHEPGIEVRVTWLCGVNRGVIGVRADAGALSSGSATWVDLRDADGAMASGGGFHVEFVDLVVTGDPCWVGEIRTDVVYGMAVGNGDDFGQYVGWFEYSTADSTAISDQDRDNVDGTVAGWFR
ncbi:MAG: hypothetical protein ACI8PZ_007386, partial [Myxococcota bacterium]